MSDPYTIRDGAQREPPTTWLGRLKYLGPSVVISGSIVGSGEIILTSSLGAAAGFVFFWWILVSCWIKSLVQAELGRYVVLSGDTYLRALNRLPGKMGRVSWPIWLGLAAFVPGVMGLGGIVGGAGQALTLLVPQLDSVSATAIIALSASVILYSGSYFRLERLMLVLVVSFTLTTLICAVTMQFTDFRLNRADLVTGFRFDFPMEFLVLALAVYGYTGVNSGETAAYTYWCVEKGYPSFVGDDRQSRGWVHRALGWVRVLQADVWVTLVILTLATVPFFVLGAGVLNALGERPQGLETLAALSNMFTQTLGGWAVWVFAVGAFCILFSSTLAGISAGGRFLPDYLIELGLLDRSKLWVRRACIRGYGAVVPLLGFVFYLGLQRPVLLVSVGAIAAAVMLPIQSGAVLWLQRRHLDRRVWPAPYVHLLIGAIFLFQLAMAYLVVRYVVF